MEDRGGCTNSIQVLPTSSIPRHPTPILPTSGLFSDTSSKMKNLSLGDFCLPKKKETVQSMQTMDLKQANQERDQIRREYNDLLSRYNDKQSEIFSLHLQIEELRNLIPQSTISSLPSYAQITKNIPASKFTPLRKMQDRSSPSKMSGASSNAKTFTINTTSASISNSTPPIAQRSFPIMSPPLPTPAILYPLRPPSFSEQTCASKLINNAISYTLNAASACIPKSTPTLSPPATKTASPITSPPLPTPPKSYPLHPPTFPKETGSSKFLNKTLPTPKRTSRQTYVPAKVPVRIYHDSNLAWSGPDAIKDTLKRVFPKQSKDQAYEVIMCFTPKLENVLQAVTQTDLENSVVIIAVMTNNAKERQPVQHTHSLLQKILDNLKRQTSSEKIIILESPPSLQFDVYPYNRASYQLCRSSGVYFALCQLERCHIKDDGLHIRDPYKHLMIKSVAAAIMKVNPYVHFELFPSVRRPWIITPWANSFMMCTYPHQFQCHSAQVF